MRELWELDIKDWIHTFLVLCKESSSNVSGVSHVIVLLYLLGRGRSPPMSDLHSYIQPAHLALMSDLYRAVVAPTTQVE